MSVALTAADQCLLHAARAGLPLIDEPFAAWGSACGSGAEAVVSRLRALAGCGLIDGVHLLRSASTPGPTPLDEVDQALLDALASGLPLVQRPWEALGAMLGVTALTVCARLDRWLHLGQVQCIAPMRQGQLAVVGRAPLTKVDSAPLHPPG